jgi:peptide/nickel transport system permease protein
MDRAHIAWFIMRRLLVLSALLVVISLLVFSLLYIAPGNAIDILLNGRPRTPQMVSALTSEYNLNKPFLTQYWIWLGHAMHLNFGISIQTQLPVNYELRSRLPTSLFLGCYAYVLTMVLGVGLGVLAAVRHRSRADRGIVVGAIVGLSTPAFVAGVMLIYLFSIVVHWFPAAGPGSGFTGQVSHLTLPAVALALGGTAFVLRHTRAAMIEILDQDYVTFARARGLSWARVVFQYELRTALVSIATISGLVLGFLITGAVVVEDTFSLPGIGQLMVLSANSKDVPVLQAVTMVAAVVIMIANLLSDVAYVLLDPRIRHARAR